MVSVAQPRLICGYHGLTTVAMFFVLICTKILVNFCKVKVE